MIIFYPFRRVAFTVIMIMYDMIYDNLLPFQESRLSGGLWQCGSLWLPGLFRGASLNNLGSHRLPDCWSPPDRPSAGHYGPPLRGGPIQGRANQVDLNNLEADGFLDCSCRAVGPPYDALRITEKLHSIPAYAYIMCLQIMEKRKIVLPLLYCYPGFGIHIAQFFLHKW